MKKDILIAGVFVVLAVLGVGGVVALLNSSEDERSSKTIRPQSEPVAILSLKTTKTEPKQNVESIRVIPRHMPIAKVTTKPAIKQEEPKVDPGKKQDEPKVVAKVDSPKETAKQRETKKDAAKEAQPPPDLIEFGEHKKLNRPNGEYIVPLLDHEDKIILLGVVKTLKLNGANGRAIIDASGLKAEQIVFVGDVLGDSRVKLYAPAGTVLFQSQINGSGEVEIIAPEGKVVFTSKNDTIATGGSKVTVTAKDVELNGEVSGGAVISVTITRDGSLKYAKLQGGPRLYYGKANSSDPEPRLVEGVRLGGAEVRKIDPTRKN